MNTLMMLSSKSQPQTPDMFMTIVMLGVMFVAMYFLMIRPQNKQRRERDVMVQNIVKGDSILTTSGFYGVIIDIMEEIVIVEFGNNKNCRIPMKKDAIVEVEKQDAE